MRSDSLPKKRAHIGLAWDHSGCLIWRVRKNTDAHKVVLQTIRDPLAAGIHFSQIVEGRSLGHEENFWNTVETQLR
jgi:hypothetical protein